MVIWTGKGRERKEHTIKLSSAQGRFLYHLPFPAATPLSIADIMVKADVDDAYVTETQTEQNVRFYENLGFRQLKRITLPIINLPQWELIREPGV